MDTLSLKGLRYEARHGYYEEERREGNRFEVDLVFTADLTDAARDDDLALTIDYEQAQRLVQQVMAGEPVKLLETLVHRIGELLFHHFAMLHILVVRVRKMNPPLDTAADYSEVTMSWQR